MTKQTHYRACHLCEALCGLVITTDDDQVTDIRADHRDPLSYGHICPKAVALQDIHADPDRLRQPIKRTLEGWQAISWEDALNLVAERLVEIQQDEGNNAVGAYFGNPSVHNWGMMTHAPHLFKHLKTRNRFSATSADQLPHQLVCMWLYGHQVLVPVPDIERTELLIVIGGNPMASNGSLWTVPGFPKRVKALQERGGKLVVMDPRRTETAAIADEHLFVRPGSDVYVLLAMLNHILTKEWVNPGHLAAHLDHLEALAPLLAPFTAKRAERLSGIPAKAIKQLAERLAKTPRAVVYGRMGISVQAHGTLCQWAIQLLNILTGHLDVEGGAMFSLPAVDVVWGPNSKPGHFAAWHTRVRGLPEFGGELPCAALAEEITTPGEGQISALITCAGNPVLSTPNGRQLETALAGLDFMVSIDIYLNETTQYADVILPPTSPLEHDHYDLALMPFSVYNTAKYSPAIFPKPEGALHDWEIFTELGKRVARLKGTTPLPDYAPTQVLDSGLRMGPYGDQLGADGLSLDTLKAQPHGVDLGAHESRLPDRLYHADKRIPCLPPLIREALLALAEEPDTPTSGFTLIGRRHVRSNNSWMHNMQRLVKGKPRHQAQISAQDAERLALTSGDWIRIASRVASLDIDVEVTDDLMPGVISIPHGWGHHRQGIALGIAAQHPGVSANDLTDDQYLETVSGNAIFNGVPVSVEKIMPPSADG